MSACRAAALLLLVLAGCERDPPRPGDLAPLADFSTVADANAQADAGPPRYANMLCAAKEYCYQVLAGGHRHNGVTPDMGAEPKRG
ncbi:MAG: hypothetical protein EXR72_10250 [Myxococcales bacterium]|nr:hypothetical protein [Myxococcales bacterium]